MSAHRDKALIRARAAGIARCAQGAPVLLVADGLSTYVGAFLRAFRTPERRPGRRPHLVPWPGLVVGQVIKQYAPGAGRRGRWQVSGVVHRLAHGTAARAAELLATTQGRGVLNTAYIERLNGTFRQHVASLGRRTRHLARREATITAGMFLVGTVYNFCTLHRSLTEQQGWGRRRTPAMAAGRADHCWSVRELLAYHVPLPRWQPPKKRGRRAKALQDLIERWAA